MAFNLHRHSHSHDHNSILHNRQDRSSSPQARMIYHVAILGCVINAILMVLKLVVGSLGHSEALMADGYHSINDFGADLIVIAFTSIAYRNANKNYPYGFGKFETFASLIISIFLLVVASHIGHEGITSIIEYFSGETLPKPDIWTLVVIIFAMTCKETLFRYSYRIGVKTNSMALITNAWHHRSDAMASVATLIGVGCAHFFGEKWRILDPCASLVIMIFIIIPAFRMLWRAYKELMDHSLHSDILDKIRDICNSQCPGITRSVQGIRSGHNIIINLTLAFPENATLAIVNNDRDKIETAIKEQYPGSIININITSNSSLHGIDKESL